APSATLWLGDAGDLHAVGMWPPGPDGPGPGAASGPAAAPGPVGLLALPGTVRPVTAGGALVGAVSVDRPAGVPLSLAEQRLFDDLTAQAGLVIGHLTLIREQARRHAP